MESKSLYFLGGETESQRSEMPSGMEARPRHLMTPCSKQFPTFPSIQQHPGAWPGGSSEREPPATSVPQEMAYLIETVRQGLAHKTTQEATEQSPLEGDLCLAL